MSARRIDCAQVRTGGHTGPPLRWELPPRRAVHPKRSRPSFRNEKKLRILLAYELRKRSRHEPSIPTRCYTFCAIATWKISNLHVDIFYFPRGRHSFPPKFHFIPPKNFFFPTWKIKILHLDISKYPRGNQFSSTQHHIDL